MNSNDALSEGEADHAETNCRILIYGMNYAPEETGVGRYTGEIGEYLSRNGGAVEVITAVPHYPGWVVRKSYRNRYSITFYNNVRVTRCPILLRKNMSGIWRLLAPLSFAMTSAPLMLWRILRARPDVVLCVEPTLFAAPVALVAAKIVSARTVLHVQDLELDAAFAVGHLRGGALKRVAERFEKVIVSLFDVVITVSNKMRERLLEKDIRKERVKVIRNWVDLRRIKPLQSESVYRAELNIGNQTLVALYAGNIGAKQALPVVLEVAERLAGTPSLLFVIAGDGPEKERLVRRYGHLPNVKFLKVQPEERLCELLNLADVHLLPQDERIADFVLPSKLGGILASGRPCIAMADEHTELHDFLDGTALLLPAGDRLALENCLRELTSSGRSHALIDGSKQLAELDADRCLEAFKASLVRCNQHSAND